MAGYVSFAGPIASSAASLGITSQPAIVSPTPTTAQVAAPVAGQQAPAVTPNAQVATGYSAAPAYAAPAQPSMAAAATAAAVPSAAASVSGGGVIGDFVNDAAMSLAEYAQNGMRKLEDIMNGETTAGGTVDPLKVQQYTQKMSSFEMIMQMAQKLQEKKENAARIWLQ